MPRYTTAGLLGVNVNLTKDGYEALQRLAPTRKTYGRFISGLLLDYERIVNRADFDDRIRKIEDVIFSRN